MDCGFITHLKILELEYLSDGIISDVDIKPSKLIAIKCPFNLSEIIENLSYITK